MVGDSYLLLKVNNSNSSGNKDSLKKSKDKKKKMTVEQSLAFRSVWEWVFLDQPSSLPSSSASFLVDDFGVHKSLGRGGEKLGFELHSHSKCSDGFLSPTKLVERAHANGVSFLILGFFNEYLYWVMLVLARLDRTICLLFDGELKYVPFL